MTFSVGRVLVRARLKALKEMLAGRVLVPQGVLFSLLELEAGGGGKERKGRGKRRQWKREDEEEERFVSSPLCILPHSCFLS